MGKEEIGLIVRLAKMIFGIFILIVFLLVCCFGLPTLVGIISFKLIGQIRPEGMRTVFSILLGLLTFSGLKEIFLETSFPDRVVAFFAKVCFPR